MVSKPRPPHAKPLKERSSQVAYATHWETIFVGKAAPWDPLDWRVRGAIRALVVAGHAQRAVAFGEAYAETEPEAIGAAFSMAEANLRGAPAVVQSLGGKWRIGHWYVTQVALRRAKPSAGIVFAPPNPPEEAKEVIRKILRCTAISSASVRIHIPPSGSVPDDEIQWTLDLSKGLVRALIRALLHTVLTRSSHTTELMWPALEPTKDFFRDDFVEPLVSHVKALLASVAENLGKTEAVVLKMENRLKQVTIDGNR